MLRLGREDPVEPVNQVNERHNIIIIMVTCIMHGQSAQILLYIEMCR